MASCISYYWHLPHGMVADRVYLKLGNASISHVHRQNRSLSSGVCSFPIWGFAAVMNGPRTEREEYIGYSREPDVSIHFELNYDEDLYPDLPAVLDAEKLSQKRVLPFHPASAETFTGTEGKSKALDDTAGTVEGLRIWQRRIPTEREAIMC